MDAPAFIAMIRSRTHENDSTEHGAILKVLRICIGQYENSVTAEELGEVKAIMGDRADISVNPVAKPEDCFAPFGMYF